jgi:aryl-alcohol dehydrogenase-like predicted oxidoreductase
MEYCEIRTSGLQISEVSLGTHALSGDGWGQTDDEASIRTVRAALDTGINLLDTAHAYGLGHCEEIIGEALKGRREEAILCTKVGNRWDAEGNRWPDLSYDSILESIEHGLSRLQTDYVDLYLLHFQDPQVEIKESMRAMSRLLDEKVIRAVGVSRYSLDRLEEATRWIDLSVAQYPLSILDRWFGLQPGLDEWHKTTPILEFCRKKGIGVMAYGGLAKGLLTGKFTGIEMFSEGDQRRRAARFQGKEFGRWVEVVQEIKPIAERYGRTLAQLAINWTLCQPGVVTGLVGARTPQQVDDNAGASGWRLEPADLREIEKIVARMQVSTETPRAS